ncbi:uncharacterized protein LOC131071813 [Cryptomeria japonica]|uniref:uncharacterized protein LOC131071813 n=1 Tax=Cryptomeria japonica TaxID=3369 RepID=UPI0027D9DF6E|nr:uncharacterized protein LOC131071813 [Cryptomeria japonica]
MAEIFLREFSKSVYILWVAVARWRSGGWSKKRVGRAAGVAGCGRRSGSGATGAREEAAWSVAGATRSRRHRERRVGGCELQGSGGAGSGGPMAGDWAVEDAGGVGSGGSQAEVATAGSLEGDRKGAGGGLVAGARAGDNWWRWVGLT